MFLRGILASRELARRKRGLNAAGVCSTAWYGMVDSVVQIVVGCDVDDHHVWLAVTSVERERCRLVRSFCRISRSTDLTECLLFVEIKLNIHLISEGREPLQI